MFEVILAPETAEFFQSAPRPLAAKLARCFKALETAPRRGNNVKRLRGALASYHRYRVGDWRVVYRVDDDDARVLVVSIAHRREVYE